LPGATSPKRVSWRSEHALNLMPSASSSSRSSGHSCELSEIFSGAMPAATARRTSYPDDASMCSPSRSNVCRTAAFGSAFIAKRTVRP